MIRDINNMKLDGLPSPEFLMLYAFIYNGSGIIQDIGIGTGYYDIRRNKINNVYIDFGNQL